MSNAHEQFENQRELARMQRAHHGADQTLDRAEKRHDVIVGWVVAAFYWFPFLLITSASWISVRPLDGWIVGTTGAVISMTIARLCGNLMGALLGTFVDRIAVTTEHIILPICGVVLAVIGIAGYSPGIVFGGFVLMATPWVWTRWARHAYANTDYARMRAAMAQPQRPPRIIE